MGSRKGSDFAGVGVAIVTPFRDGKLDVKRLQEQIDFQISSGVTFLVPVGTTGESPTLSHDEHERVISEVIQAARGRESIEVAVDPTAESIRCCLKGSKHEKSVPRICFSRRLQFGFSQCFCR